jgi:2-keto-4-pentenoate hydratase/2-oxohepta-3-ene-1,7-dioic acid hydratase in catechol pathway
VKLVMFRPKGMDLERGWPGRVDGETVVQLAAQTLQVFFAVGGALREHAAYRLAEVDLRAPVLHPPSIRLFEDGLEFVFGNTAAVFGPGEEIRYPEGSRQLRSRPAVAAVIGADGSIGGFTAANAWTAPDLTGAKRYDFALSLGPVLMTADEYDGGGDWDALVQRASLNTVLPPGDLLVRPLGPEAPAERGESVEVSVEGIGVLRSGVS